MEQISMFWIWTIVGAGGYALVCGGFGAYVADKKDRSRFEGFMFGFFLGPIGVVAAACLPDLRKIKLDETVVNPAGVVQNRVEGYEDERVRVALAKLETKIRRVVERDRRLPGVQALLGDSALSPPLLPDSWIAPDLRSESALNP
jgi:hypothetical protein